MTQSIFNADFKAEPYWWDEAPPSAGAVDALPVRADVAVVGAGVTGLSCALTLARAGAEVVVLEAETLGAGASSRNAGFIGRTVVLPFSALVKHLGREAAIAIHAEGNAAVAYTAELIKREQIRCHWRVSGRFTPAARPRHYRALARELEFTARHVAVDGEPVPPGEERREIDSARYHGGVLHPGAAEMQPALFVHGL